MSDGEKKKTTRGNVQNLNLIKTTEEARKRGRNGGIASGKARRAKKSMEDSVKILLTLAVTDSPVLNPEDENAFSKIKAKNLTVQDKMLVEVVKKALRGDLKAIEFLRDTAGEKPVDNIKQDVSVKNPFSELSTEELRQLIDDDEDK